MKDMSGNMIKAVKRLKRYPKGLSKLEEKSKGKLRQYNEGF